MEVVLCKADHDLEMIRQEETENMADNNQKNNNKNTKRIKSQVAVVYPEKEEYANLKVTNNGVAIAPNTVIVDAQFDNLSFTISG